MIDIPALPQQIQLSPEELKLQEYENLYPESLRKSLLDTVNDLEVQQKTIRETCIQEWKQLDYYWQGFQNRYWSEGLNDWRPYEEGIKNGDTDLTENDIGRVINVYRSFGESIIAGLSSSLPGVRFAPDNADNPEDLSTAKAYGKIADLISVHNNASLLMIKALFTLFNQAFVAAYNYHHTSPEYGTVKTPKFIEEEQEVSHEICTTCGMNLDDESAQENQFEGEFFNSKSCPNCGDNVVPQIETSIETVVIPTYEECPKSREIIEIYGPMNVQIPFYITDIKNSPYLILETEHHISLAKALFPHLADKITPENSYSSYERWARQPSEAFDTRDLDLVTFRRVWLRRWAYWTIKDEETRKTLESRFPNGVYFLYLNDVFAEAVAENIDDHWTVSQSPTSQYIHAAPIGRPLKDIQDMTNDMYNLTLRTILYGIPMTFAESNTIDWDKYKETPSEPGMVFPAKVQPGQNLSGMFHTIKTASLSQEVDKFGEKLNSAGQFVSGAFPSIYGGTLQGGSGTYKEYESSRNQALQRLSLSWKTLNIWWKDTIYKAAKEYARNVMQDESYAKRNGDSYINIWIRKAELQGKVGDVEAETSDQFPISSQQKRDLILTFLQNPSPMIQTILAHPENIGLVTRLVGFGELYVPGNDQRNKQLVENLQLLVSEPVPGGMPMDPMTGMSVEIFQPSVPIEEIDNHQIHLETGQAFMVSEAGQYLKQTNPAGYQNVMLHYQAHQMVLQAQAQAQMQQQMEMQNGGNDGSGNPGSESGGSSGNGNSGS